MLSVSITILTVLLVVISLLMILIILMQRPKQEGLGAAFGGGMMNDIAGAHTTDILQKGTVWLSVFFFCIAILLGILYTKQISGRNNESVLDGVKQEQLPPLPPPSIGDFPPAPAPATTPENPATPSGETPNETAPKPAPANEGEPGTAPKPADPKPGGAAAETPESAPEGGEPKKAEPAESGNPQ